MALITIITPCYNSSQFISQTINSVLSQDFMDWEYILVDDCSTDGTVGILSEYEKLDKRIIIVKLNSNSGGPAHPRNVGLSMAKGEYIAFLDADDIWLPQKLSLQLKWMIEKGHIFSSTDFYKFKGSINRISHFDKEIKTSFIDHWLLLKKNIIWNSSVIIKKNLINSYRFDERKEYVAIEDYHLWLRLHRDFNLKSLKIKCPLLLYRKNNEGISASKIKMAKKIFNLLKEYEIAGKRLGYRRLYYFLMYCFKSLLVRDR